MKKIIKSLIALLVVILIILNTSFVNAVPAKPPEDGEMPGNGGAPGEPGGGSSNVSHTGATTISSDTTDSGKTYSSSNSSENALLVSGGTSTLTDVTVNKSGDSDGDNSDFYGTNAAILAVDGTININGGTVETDGAHANAVFAYSSGVINITDTVINTSSNNSGAVMVTGGGNLTANNVTATTQGNSSAPIRSDRGGGTLTVNGGTYTANGVGSPAIYSTADITVNDATLISTSSEGAVVEGKNSITLKNTKLIDTNTSLNGNSETYKNIFLYQSMSGDADEGTASFTAENSEITTNKGDTIFVTNTTAKISLSNNTIVNNDEDGGFLRIQSGKWGNSGSNGGNVSLEATEQEISGDIFVDEISLLDMTLSDNSSYTGTINNSNSAKEINITLDSSSTITLTGDSYVNSLKNEVSDNSNINLNGYKLYVNGVEIDSTEYSAIQNSVNNESEENIEEQNKVQEDKKEDTFETVIISVGIILVIVLAFVLFFKFRTRNI